MFEAIKEKIEKADVVNFATVAGVILFIILTVAGLVVAVFQPEVLENWERVYIITMPTISAIFIAYGIINREE